MKAAIPTGYWEQFDIPYWDSPRAVQEIQPWTGYTPLSTAMLLQGAAKMMSFPNMPSFSFTAHPAHPGIHSTALPSAREGGVGLARHAPEVFWTWHDRKPPPSLPPSLNLFPGFSASRAGP